jgi:hypothetical protein
VFRYAHPQIHYPVAAAERRSDRIGQRRIIRNLEQEIADLVVWGEDELEEAFHTVDCIGKYGRMGPATGICFPVAHLPSRSEGHPRRETQHIPVFPLLNGKFRHPVSN